MKLIDRIESKIDKTIKYVFQVGNQIIETSYIDNGSDKDIICVASQTMCNMKCSFCHLTDMIGKVKVNNLTAEGITEQVDYIYKDLNLEKNNRRLHISYMGCGEALDNLQFVELSMVLLSSEYENITFGLSTILPKKNWRDFFRLAETVKISNIPLKVHLSLHYTNDEQRSENMPSALDIKSAISALEFYKNITGNPVEVHYTMIKGQNDMQMHEAHLGDLLKGRGISIKFLRFNDKETSDNEEAEMNKIERFMNVMKHRYRIECEYYESPGRDIGASCGQFLLEKLTKEETLN